MANPYRKYTSYWWRHYFYVITSLHRSIPYKVRILVDYLPVIWRDQSCDYAFLFALLEVKFRRMRRYTEKHGHVVSWEKQAREYLICEQLMKRIYADEYLDYEAYGKIKGNSDQAHRARMRMIEHEQLMQKQDIAYFCRLMQRKIFTWWD